MTHLFFYNHLSRIVVITILSNDRKPSVSFNISSVIILYSSKIYSWPTFRVDSLWRTIFEIDLLQSSQIYIESIPAIISSLSLGWDLQKLQLVTISLIYSYPFLICIFILHVINYLSIIIYLVESTVHYLILFLF